jgi:hypothetical protein
MYRRPLWSPHDVEDDGLMRVAAKAPDFEIAVPGVERIAKCRRRLRRSREASMRLFQASTASRSARLRASFARSAAARTDEP